MNKISITAISDLHGDYPKLEGGDLLIVAGDLTALDKGFQYALFESWLCEQKYRRKIVIAGNHDKLIQKGHWNFAKPDEDVTYLQDNYIEFEGYKIYGSPWSRYFAGVNPHCNAYMHHHDITMEETWAKIPDDVDILVTHTPAHNILDISRNGERYGCRYLAKRLQELKQLKLHVFGHLHAGYGEQLVTNIDSTNAYKAVNAAHNTEDYEPINPPIRVVI